MFGPETAYILRSSTKSLRKSLSYTISTRAFAVERKKRKAWLSTYSSTFETHFVNALVQAGRCRADASQRTYGFNDKNIHQPDRTPFSPRPALYSTLQSDAGSIEHLHLPIQPQSREDLVNILDYYDGYSREEDSASSLRQEKLGALQPKSPRLGAPYQRVFPHLSMESFQVSTITVRKIVLLIEPDTPNDLNEIFALYESLPAPRMYHISPRTAHRLLHLFSLVRYKTPLSATRYLTLMDDARETGLPLTSIEWSSAISFAGRRTKNISNDNISQALQVFRDMESSDHQAASAHLTVLFDIATKAGKFALADMIHAELTARNLPPNRYTHTARIFHYGLRGDGDGVRASYRHLVESGEIVDTVVITTVIKSLVLCGEASAAEQVFARMKALHRATASDAPAPKDNEAARSSATGLPLRPPPVPRTWREQKAYGHALDRAATALRGQPNDMRTTYQAAVTLAPTLPTYKALLYHYSVGFGDFDRVTALLDELPAFGLPLHGSIFLFLFKAFAIHGGIRYTAWTLRRLEGAWERFWELARESAGVGQEKGEGEGEQEQEQEDGIWRPPRQGLIDVYEDDVIASSHVYVSKTAVMVALRAFAKCASRERTFEVWMMVKQSPDVWRMTLDEEEEVDEMLRYITE